MQGKEKNAHKVKQRKGERLSYVYSMAETQNGRPEAAAAVEEQICQEFTSQQFGACLVTRGFAEVVQSFVFKRE
jgi:hypothetical protein